MRHPLNPGYRITTHFSSSHPGTDYAPPTPGQTGVSCHAPERSEVVIAGTGTVEGKYVILRGLDTGKFYYFGHFASHKVSSGGVIAEGTVIGTLGMTGKATGIHTHCEVRDVRKATYSQKHDPETWFKSHITPPSSGGGSNEVFQNIQEVTEAYVQMRGAPGTDAEMRPWIGQSKQRWIQLSTLETNSTRQQLAEVRQALLNEQSKPPKEIVKEVEKIIEKPVEVIKEIEVVREVTVERFPAWVPGWLKSILEAIFKERQ